MDKFEGFSKSNSIYRACAYYWKNMILDVTESVGVNIPVVDWPGSEKFDINTGYVARVIFGEEHQRSLRIVQVDVSDFLYSPIVVRRRFVSIVKNNLEVEIEELILHNRLNFNTEPILRCLIKYWSFGNVVAISLLETCLRECAV
ncbi:MAG: hypothetical protein GY861_21830 [bacterium]|nr:hypothetical protein [bacterium]